MREIKLVTDFTRLTQLQALNLPLDMYLLNLKNAFICDKMQTEEGRDYLKKAYRLRQTKPDLDKIRRLDGYKPE